MYMAKAVPARIVVADEVAGLEPSSGLELASGSMVFW